MLFLNLIVHVYFYHVIFVLFFDIFDFVCSLATIFEQFEVQHQVTLYQINVMSSITPKRMSCRFLSCNTTSSPTEMFRPVFQVTDNEGGTDKSFQTSLSARVVHKEVSARRPAGVVVLLEIGCWKAIAVYQQYRDFF